jgi:serine/threonine-protein kinase
MGQVFLAITGQPEEETLCVVKRLLPELRRDPEFLARFADEANLARRLSHSNLVATYATGQIEGEPFLAQEYVEGHDLADVRTRSSIDGLRIPIDLSVYLVSQVARGLAYAHDFEDLGLVHRDINPTNVRVTYAGEVKVIDFGVALSKLKTVRTAPGEGIWGKLTYMAPEQLSGGVVDRRADLYALGIVLWELLARRPFGTKFVDGQVVLPKETRDELFERILKKDPLLPSALNPDVLASLDAVTMKALARHPGDRFQTAEEFRQALGEAAPVRLNAEGELAQLLGRLYAVEEERRSRRELVQEGRALLADGPPAEVRPVIAPRKLQERDGPRGAHGRPIVAIGLAALAVVAVGVAVAWHRSDHVQSARPQPAIPVAAAPEPQPAPVLPLAPEAVPRPTAPPPLAGQVPTQPGQGPRPKRPRSAVGSSSEAAPDPRFLLDAGEDAFNRKDFVDAIQLGQRALKAGGGAPAHVLLGNSYVRSGRPRDAEREYAEALKLTPSDSLVKERLEAVRDELQAGENR